MIGARCRARLFFHPRPLRGRGRNRARRFAPCAPRAASPALPRPSIGPFRPTPTLQRRGPRREKRSAKRARSQLGLRKVLSIGRKIPKKTLRSRIVPQKHTRAPRLLPERRGLTVGPAERLTREPPGQSDTRAAAARDPCPRRTHRATRPARMAPGRVPRSGGHAFGAGVTLRAMALRRRPPTPAHRRARPSRHDGRHAGCGASVAPPSPLRSVLVHSATLHAPEQP